MRCARSGAFKPVNDIELAFINEMKRDHLVCPPGAEIIAAGQEQVELYTLYAGWAFRCKTLPDGRRQILNILLPGDLIGLQGAMFEAAAYSVEAITEVQICVLPRRKVWSLFENMPELAFDVTWLGAREESIVDENLTSAGRRTAAERIAALIIQLYKRARRARHGGQRRDAVSAHAAAHRRRARPVAGPHQQVARQAAQARHVFADNGTLLLSNPKRAGKPGAIFRRRGRRSGR